jgi:hypothetical protein
MHAGDLWQITVRDIKVGGKLPLAPEVVQQIKQQTVTPILSNGEWRLIQSPDPNTLISTAPTREPLTDQDVINVLQTAAAAASLIPGYGTPISIASAIVYLLQGDPKSAGFAAAAALPFGRLFQMVGNLAGKAPAFSKALGAAAKIVKAAKPGDIAGPALKQALREVEQALAREGAALNDADRELAQWLLDRTTAEAEALAPAAARIVRGTNPSRVIFDGMEVRAVRDLSHLEEGTLRAMQRQGFAARDINGQPLELHHLNQNPAGPLVEIPKPSHNIGNRVQHPLGNQPGGGLTPEQRAAFNDWRTRYWQERAREELARRGLQ